MRSERAKMRGLSCLVCACVLAVGWPHAARAQSRALRAAPRSGSGAWYGWQTLAVDGVGLALIGSSVAGLATGYSSGATAAVPLGLGLIGFVVATPTVHSAHRRNAAIGASLGMRSAGILVSGVSGAVVGTVLDCAYGCHGEYAGLSGSVYGGLAGASIGAVVAIVVDATVFAYGPTAPKPAQPQALRWLPTAGYDPRLRSGTVGMVGTF